MDLPLSEYNEYVLITLKQSIVTQKSDAYNKCHHGRTNFSPWTKIF